MDHLLSGMATTMLQVKMTFKSELLAGGKHKLYILWILGASLLIEFYISRIGCASTVFPGV